METTISNIKQLLEAIEKDELFDNYDDVPITFEFLMNSLFPEAADNFKKLATQQFIEGYNQGICDGLHGAAIALLKLSGDEIYNDEDENKRLN